MAKWCIEMGADNLNSALKGAAEGNHRDLLDWVLTKGVKLMTGHWEDEYWDFNRALEGAIQAGNLDMARWAVDRGARDFFPAQHCLDLIPANRELWEYCVETAFILGTELG